MDDMLNVLLLCNRKLEAVFIENGGREADITHRFHQIATSDLKMVLEREIYKTINFNERQLNSRVNIIISGFYSLLIVKNDATVIDRKR